MAATFVDKKVGEAEETEPTVQPYEVSSIRRLLPQVRNVLPAALRLDKLKPRV